MASSINLFNPKQTTKIGLVCYTNPKNGQKVELPVYERFWGCGYQPNPGQILLWLVQRNHRVTANAYYVAVM